jgi:hypothetical protein
VTNPMYIEQDNQAAARTGLNAVLPFDPTFSVSNTAGNAIRAEGGSGQGKLGVSALADVGVGGFSEGGTAGVAGVGSAGALGVLAQGIESDAMRAISASDNALMALSNTRSIFAWGRDHGIETWSHNGNAVFAINEDATHPALWASSSAQSWAAGFVGSVAVFGNAIVTGFKHAVVDHPDGSHRLLYSMEAPEPWFEDFGRASLRVGAATVSLESTFAALVSDDDDYHVFVTPEGDCNGLYVSNRRSDSFEVHECQGGTSDVPFSYRLAIRRSDIDGERFKSAELPERPDIAAAQETARQAEAHLRQAEQGPRLWEPPES